MMTDPFFYAAAIPAVIMVGLSKGGFGGAMALLGVPLMALAISPVQAAAILLPILVVMDIVTLWSWRSHKDATTLRIMVPFALIGVGIGWVTAAWVTVPMIRLIVGILALWFVWRYLVENVFVADKTARPAPRQHQPGKGMFWGTFSGFTSFVSHAGGPLPDVHLAASARSKNLYRYECPLLRRRQRGQAGALFRSRAVRRNQPVYITRPGTIGAGGDAGSTPSS